MTTTDTPPPASTEEKHASIKLVTDNAQRIFQWNYDRERDQLVTLYNKGMASQWNSVTELDWDTDVDPEEVVRTQSTPIPFVEIARAAAKISGSPFAKWSDKEFTQLGIESLKSQLSQFMHGEQGAMLAAAKIVETVPWIDAKYYASTQTMDEARHTEVFAKYLHTKLGEAYPISPFLDAALTALIEDGRWDITYLGMQIVIESLALAAFGGMIQAVEEPLLNKLLRYVLADEARHVAFGILSLREYYEELTDAELKERQDYLAENTLRSRSRSVAPEMWERLDIDFEAALPSIMEAASTIDQSLFTSFERGFYSKLVPNVRKLGLLDANNGYLRRLWGEAGLLEYEFAEDTASDYESYDAVARDRAAGSTV